MEDQQVIIFEDNVSYGVFRNAPLQLLRASLRLSITLTNIDFVDRVSFQGFSGVWGEAKESLSHLFRNLDCCACGFANSKVLGSAIYENIRGSGYCLMEPSANEADVVLNRLNVALARSQRIINSWLPQKAQPEEERQHEDNDEDFKPMPEERGVGFSDDGPDDNDSIARTLQRRKRLSSNDRLLEQLIGKKAAQAKRKSHESGKSMSVAKHAAPKAMVSRPKQAQQVESDDEEGGGRAAAFMSRKASKRQSRTIAENMAVDHDENDHIASQTLNSTGSPGLTDDAKSTAVVTSERDERTSKKKSNTYLDELLAQKARKKKNPENSSKS